MPACEQRLLLDLWSTPCPSANNAPPEFLEGPEFLWSASSDGVPALVEAEEYCVELECLDVRTGIPFWARRCEPDPGLEPVEVDVLEFDEADLGIDDGCEVPPAGFEPDWCDLNRAYFENYGVWTNVYAVFELRCAEYETRCLQAAGEEPVEPGCGCHAARSPGAAAGAWLGLLALGSLRRRRRGAAR